MAFSDARPVYTIGHSYLDFSDFLANLLGARVQLLVDVRARPRNPFVSSFDKSSMKMRLYENGIVYFFMGHRLGERPPDRDLYLPDGRVAYGRYEKSDDYKAAIQWLIDRCRESRLCLMAGRGEPWSCHRHWLLAQSLIIRGIPVIHIMPDGSHEKAAVDLLHWREALARVHRLDRNDR